GRAELLQFGARDGGDGEACLGDATSRDQRWTESVGVLARVAHQVAGGGELVEDAEHGRLGQVELARQLRQAEALAALLDEEVQHPHHADGGSGTACGHSELRDLTTSGKARRERSEEHRSELQSREKLVCRLLLEN